MIRLLLLAGLVLLPVPGRAAEVRVLTAGAYKAVLTALAPGFTQRTGDTLAIANETVGGVQQKLRNGEPADLVILTPGAIEQLGSLVQDGSARDLARVGIAVAVRAGAPHPDISTPDAIRAAVIAARAPAWIDPAAGGSSGIYMGRLWERWGIASLLLPKAVLVNGGYVADKLLNNEADLGFQQQSELVGHPGVEVVGLLPEPIQLLTTYAGAIPAASKQPAQAAALLAYLAGPDAAATLATYGMTRP